MSTPIKLALLALLVAPACAAGGEDTDGEAVGPATAETENDGRSDGELRVRAGEMTMWIDREVELSTDADGEVVATIHGRTSRNLTFAGGWVPDDGFGTTTIVGPRSFDIELRRGHEVNTMISGLPLFVALEVSTGTTRRYDARIDLEAGFGRFTGTSTVWVDATLRPVHAGTTDDPLRYRGRVHTATSELTIGQAGSPVITPVAGGYLADWSFADLADVLASNDQVIFQSHEGAQKKARGEVRASRIGLTTDAADVAWPAQACTPAIWDCVHAGGDLAACGTFREVNGCLYADVCEVFGSSPLVLDPLDLSFVWADARADYVAGCGSGGQWCSIDTMASFMAPECLAEPATIEDVVTLLLGDDQDWGGDPFGRGTVLDRAGLGASPVFGASYSPGGPALLAAIDAHMGGGTVLGWHLVEEVPCPNCTDFRDVYVLWYPDAFRAIVIEAGHGYDS